MISLIGTVRKLRQVKRAKKFLYENFPFKNPLESQQIMINISLQITWRNPRTLPQNMTIIRYKKINWTSMWFLCI